MHCLSNLHKCKAACCKEVSVLINNPGTKYSVWLISKGCKVLERPKNKILVIVPKRCSALTQDNKCKFHGTDKKPLVCRRFDENHTENTIVPENCLVNEVQE